MKKVLIVDDSALVRKQLRGLIEELGFEVDTAKNGQEGVEKAIAEDFAVITMDVNMPIMDGITAVKKIMQAKPTPILMVSSLTSEDASTTIEALENGAVDYVAKPGTFNVGLATTGDDLAEKILTLSKMSTRKLARNFSALKGRASRKEHAPIAMPKAIKAVDKVLLIGASTGGPGLIEEICASLPANFPYAVFIVQHMPEKFTSTFATRLARVSALSVTEAVPHEEVSAGCIYIAKGGVHMHFGKKVSGKIIIRLESNKGNRFFQPSVDEMMLSALQVFDPKKIVAVLLTGIGDDGAQGMVAIKKAGGFTFGESEETATVYGMPRVAYENGGVSQQLPFPQIVSKLMQLQ